MLPSVQQLVQFADSNGTGTQTVVFIHGRDGLYDREDIARHDGQIRAGYESLNVLYARSTELYELALTDGILLDHVLPALERHKTLIDQTNEQLANQIDRIR